MASGALTPNNRLQGAQVSRQVPIGLARQTEPNSVLYVSFGTTTTFAVKSLKSLLLV